MLNPYFLMAILYASLAVLAALDASLTSFNLLPWFNGLRWLRVHLITLGLMTQVIFGLLPWLAAARSGGPKPKTRWDIWLCLNAGLLTLLVGIPLVNPALIFTGGTLVFAAAVLLMRQLSAARPRLSPPPAAGNGTGRKFYLAGLGFLLLGITVGTGLWLGWGGLLRMASPIEVHIHANNWGFMALVFAGLLADLYPGFAGRPLAWPRSIRVIFWMMTAAALALVAGPWVGSPLFTAPGILIYLAATLWLLLNVVRPLAGDPLLRTPGMWHLISAHVWIVAPVLVAPLIILQVPGFPGAGIEANAPQALIYGWVLQFGFALLPYLFARAFLPDQPAKLGGSWFSLATLHLGGALLWASIFAAGWQAGLHGAAYGFWTLALLSLALDLWRIVRTGLARLEATGSAQPLSDSAAVP